MKKIFFGLLFLVVMLFIAETHIYAKNYCTDADRAGSNTICVNGKEVLHTWSRYKNCADNCTRDSGCEEDGVDNKETGKTCGGTTGGNTGGGTGNNTNNNNNNNTNNNTAPTCNTKTAASASIEPDIVMPWRDVIVRCGYGEDLDCVSVTGGGLTNCTVRAYASGETIFACKAGGSPGVYTDAKCVLSEGTAGKCCKGEKPVGQYNVLSTAAHFSQRMRLPAGTYTLTVKEQTSITKGNGAFVDVLCASPDCGGGKKENDSLVAIPFTTNTAFETKTASVAVPAEGNNKDYKVRIVAGEGSELYVSSISLSGGGKEYVLNGDFKSVKQTPNTAKIFQPNAWTDASNRLGYYYGMAINTNIPIADTSAGKTPSTGSSGTANTGGATKVTLKLKLQGIAKKPKIADPITVKVKLQGKQAGAAAESQSVSFSVADDGVWTGTGNFSSPAGDGYTLFVKGPKHLQKKICDMVPTETSGGAYRCTEGRIALKAGDNTIDLTKIIMLVGDLPEKGTQNGIIDSYDTSYVRQHLQSTKAEELAVGDLNFDGVIDAQDFSLGLAALSIKYDEE